MTFLKHQGIWEERTVLLTTVPLTTVLNHGPTRSFENELVYQTCEFRLLKFEFLGFWNKFAIQRVRHVNHTIMSKNSRILESCSIMRLSNFWINSNKTVYLHFIQGTVPRTTVPRTSLQRQSNRGTLWYINDATMVLFRENSFGYKRVPFLKFPIWEDNVLS